MMCLADLKKYISSELSRIYLKSDSFLPALWNWRFSYRSPFNSFPSTPPKTAQNTALTRYELKLFVMTPRCALDSAPFNFIYLGLEEVSKLTQGQKYFQPMRFHPFSDTQNRTHLGSESLPYSPTLTTFQRELWWTAPHGVCQHPWVQNRILLEGTWVSSFICLDFSRAPKQNVS